MIEFDYQLLDEHLPGYFEKKLCYNPFSCIVRYYPDVFYDAKFDVIAEFELFSFNEGTVDFDRICKEATSFREAYEAFEKRDLSLQNKAHVYTPLTGNSSDKSVFDNVLYDGLKSGFLEIEPMDQGIIKNIQYVRKDAAKKPSIGINAILSDFKFKQRALFTVITAPKPEVTMNRKWTEDYADLVLAILDGCYYDNGKRKPISNIVTKADDFDWHVPKVAYAKLCYSILSSRSLFILYNYWRYDEKNTKRLKLYLSLVASYLNLLACNDQKTPICIETLAERDKLINNEFSPKDISEGVSEVRKSFRNMCNYNMLRDLSVKELGEHIVSLAENFYEETEDKIESKDAELKVALKDYDEELVAKLINCDYDIRDIHLGRIADDWISVITKETSYASGEIFFDVGASGSVYSAFGDYYVDWKEDDRFNLLENTTPVFLRDVLCDDCHVDFEDKEYYEKLKSIRWTDNWEQLYFHDDDIPADLDFRPYYEYEINGQIRRKRDFCWKEIANLLANLGLCLENMYLFNYVTLEDDSGLFDDVDCDSLIDTIRQRVYGKRFGKSIKKTLNKLNPEKIANAEKNVQLETAKDQVSILRKFPRMLEQFIDEVKDISEIDDFMVKRQHLLDNISNFELDDEIIAELGDVTNKICEKLNAMISEGEEEPDLVDSIRSRMASYCASLKEHVRNLYDGTLTEDALDGIVNKALSYIVTGEILYDMYVKEKSQYKLLDFGCVAIEYYKAVEYLMNSILYYPYYSSVLSTRSINSDVHTANQEERPYCGSQLNYITYSRMVSGKKQYFYKQELEYGTIARFFNKTISEHQADKLFDFLQSRGVNLNKLRGFSNKMIQTADLRNQCAHPNQNQKEYAVKARDVIYERDMDHINEISLVTQAQGIRELIFKFDSIFE